MNDMILFQDPTIRNSLSKDCFEISSFGDFPMAPSLTDLQIAR